MIQLGLNIFFKFADESFVVCFLVVKELKIWRKIMAVYPIFHLNVIAVPHIQAIKKQIGLCRNKFQGLYRVVT